MKTTILITAILLFNSVVCQATSLANKSPRDLVTQLTQGVGRVHQGFYYSWEKGAIYKEIENQKTKTRSAQALAPITYLISPKVSFIICLKEYTIPTLCDSTKQDLDILMPVLTSLHKKQQYQFQLVVNKSDPKLTKRFIKAVKQYFEQKKTRGVKMHEKLINFEQQFTPELYQMLAEIEQDHNNQHTAQASLMTLATK